MAASEFSEFSFLEAEAAEVGRTAPVPAVRRVALTPEVSAISWGDQPAEWVLIHGVALNAHTWDAAVLAWPGEGAGFLAVDLPGHGDSPWRTDANYSPAVLAASLAEALAAATAAGLLQASPIVVGHSLGGLVTLEMLQRASFAIRQLILVDILPLPPQAAQGVADFLNGPQFFESRDAIVRRALAFGLGGSRESLERAVYLNTRVDADAHVVWKHHFGQIGGAGLHLADPESVWPVIASSTTPIDLVSGTASLLDDALVGRFQQVRPQAAAVRITGGHNLQEDNPAVLAATLADLGKPGAALS